MAIATNKPVRPKTGFVVQGHISVFKAQNMLVTSYVGHLNKIWSLYYIFALLYTTVKKFGAGKIFLIVKKMSCSSRLHLFDQNSLL